MKQCDGGRLNERCRYSNVRSTPPWAKQLEAELAAGKTLVTFTAVSGEDHHAINKGLHSINRLNPLNIRPTASGNDSDSCSLTVRVRDAVAPRVYNCPSDFNVYLDEGQVKRQVGALL